MIKHTTETLGSKVFFLDYANDIKPGTITRIFLVKDTNKVAFAVQPDHEEQEYGSEGERIFNSFIEARDFLIEFRTKEIADLRKRTAYEEPKPAKAVKKKKNATA
jgi:hypothetical protein